MHIENTVRDNKETFNGSLRTPSQKSRWLQPAPSSAARHGKRCEQNTVSTRVHKRRIGDWQVDADIKSRLDRVHVNRERQERKEHINVFYRYQMNMACKVKERTVNNIIQSHVTCVDPDKTLKLSCVTKTKSNLIMIHRTCNRKARKRREIYNTTMSCTNMIAPRALVDDSIPVNTLARQRLHWVRTLAVNRTSAEEPKLQWRAPKRVHMIGLNLWFYLYNLLEIACQLIRCGENPGVLLVALHSN